VYNINFTSSHTFNVFFILVLRPPRPTLFPYTTLFRSVLVTDLPPEEAGAVQPLFRNADLETVFLVSPTSPPARMSRAARLSSGFLYVVSRPGTTGARDSLPSDLSRTVARARRAAREDLPVAVGFGIATPAAARLAA